MNLHFLAGPIIGGIIGLITNGIAIRMLFRPLKPIKLLGVTLPFTPGIIPKEKPRIAKSVGQVVGKSLVNADVLKRGLLSESVEVKIRNTITSYVSHLEKSQLTLSEWLLSTADEAKANNFLQTASEKTTCFLYGKVKNMGLGNLLADAALAEVTQNSMFAAFSFLINQNTLNTLREKIAETIEKLIETRGEALIQELVNQELNTLINTPCSELISRFGGDTEKIQTFVINLWHQIVNEKLDSVVSTLDIASLVEEQINGFDIMELEKIILDIMKKELNAIIWLGGLLGLIMGVIMNFV